MRARVLWLPGLPAVFVPKHRQVRRDHGGMHLCSVRHWNTGRIIIIIVIIIIVIIIQFVIIMIIIVNASALKER